jgi:cyclase
MSKWQYTKGLHDLGNGCLAYLQPDGGWGWSNAGLIVDGGENLLVDTLFDLKLTREMLDEMRDKVPSAAKIKTLVNTHANGDHTFGNQLVSGAEIIATRQTAEEMFEFQPQRIKDLKAGRAQLGEGAQFLYEMMAKNFDWDDVVYTPPTRTFSERLDLKVGDKDVQLIYAGPAHTKGDTLVYIPKDKTVFAGDLLFVGGHPVIWAGPVGNWIKACDLILGWEMSSFPDTARSPTRAVSRASGAISNTSTRRRGNATTPAWIPTRRRRRSRWILTWIGSIPSASSSTWRHSSGNTG